MAKTKGNQLPPVHKHKTGQARTRISGKDFYLGVHGTPEAKEEYERLVAEWLAAGRPQPWSGPVRGSAGSWRRIPKLTLAELMVLFLAWAKEHYRKGGKPTSEMAAMKRALSYAHRLYGRRSLTEFGPVALKACRCQMVEDGLCRGTCNSYVGRIRRMFRWGTENELVPVEAYQALMAVRGLERGRTEAPEGRAVKPAEPKAVELVRARVSRQVRAMIDLQLLTGMRPGEVCQMRARDLKTSGEDWQYQPESHKTEHHGRERVVHLGPRAREIVSRFLSDDLEAPLFDPRAAEAERQALRRAEAKSPRSGVLSPKALGERRRPPRAEYDVDSYRRAIARACKDAGIPVWCPNQLRHNAATAIRAHRGVEAAQTVLGHSSLSTTEIYAERDDDLAAQVMREIG